MLGCVERRGLELSHKRLELYAATPNPDFKVTTIQRQITRKWYSTELYLQWPINRKSNGAIFNDL